MSSPYDPIAQDRASTDAEPDPAPNDRSLIWARIKDAVLKRTQTQDALKRAHDGLLCAHRCSLESSLDAFGLSKFALLESTKLRAITGCHRDEFSNSIQELMDSSLWERWHELCGLSLLPQQRWSYVSLARNSPYKWLPFTAANAHTARLKEIFERSLLHLFGQLPNSTAGYTPSQVMTASLKLPKVANLKRLGPNDWRTSWVVEFNRIVQVLAGKPPNAYFPQQMLREHNKSMTLHSLEVILPTNGEIHLCVLSAAVLDEINRILTSQPQEYHQ